MTDGGNRVKWFVDNGDGTTTVMVLGADHKRKSVTVLTEHLANAALEDVYDAVTDPNHPLRVGLKQSAKDAKGQ